MAVRLILPLSLEILFIASLSSPSEAQVRTGIEVLRSEGFELLQGKRVGLITNPTGTDGQLRSTIDILNEHVNLTALFGPEHGVRGDHFAGTVIGDQVDERTGIPVYSLYGTSRKPSDEALDRVDVLVYDIQDLGVRSYTYISTMGLVMEAATEADKEVIVLDRPNPLGGILVEGPLVEPGFHSFVSRYRIPYRYGLTCGELALYLNGEGLLDQQRKCRLKVVPMEGWRREMTFPETGLPWIPPSPHIPDMQTAFFNPATGIIGELDPNMIGVGYTLPFRLMATREVDAFRLADSLNSLGLEGVRFSPIFFTPYYMAGGGIPMQGVLIHLSNPGRIPLTEIQFWFLQEAHKIDPSFNPFRGKGERYRMFDQVCGSDVIRLSMTGDCNFDRVKDIWRKDAEAFRDQSESYYLYPAP